jgi:hypothetical protein
MKTRSIEMIRCWMNGTWDTAFQNIPANTPEGDIDRVAIDAHISELQQAKLEVAHVAVYCTNDDQNDDQDDE